jgi:NitT/TauT family transport system substrate-binding protein
MSITLRRTILLLVVSLSLTGAASARPTGDTAQQADKVNYATSFGQFGRDAYVYAAIEKGYFAKENIEVNVTSGTGSVDVMKLVAAGRLDYGVADIGAQVVTKANENLPVRTISVVHQNTMSAILTLAEANIKKPGDLVGKTLADSPASTVRILFPLYARKAKIDPASVKWRDAAPPALPGLLASKQVDGIGQFVVGRPTVSLAAGKAIDALRYSDYLQGLLGIGVMASEDTIRTKADVTRRFVRALNKGLTYAIANPKATAAILKKHQPLVNEAAAADELEIMKFFVATKGTKRFGVGYIDEAKMKSTRSIIVNGGFQLSNPRIAYKDLYAPGFVKVGTYTEPKKKK